MGVPVWGEVGYTSHHAADSPVVKGTQQGTTTNAEGYFELKGVDEKVTLVITATNIETREIILSGRSDLAVLNVKMKVTSLDEMQIIAYEQSAKRLQTGNVSTVEFTDIEKAPVGNVLLAVAGRVPGAFITQSSGITGSSISVQIQGQNSISNGLRRRYSNWIKISHKISDYHSSWSRAQKISPSSECQHYLPKILHKSPQIHSFVGQITK